jgi:hypothetical protein
MTFQARELRSKKCIKTRRKRYTDRDVLETEMHIENGE